MCFRVGGGGWGGWGPMSALTIGDIIAHTNLYRRGPEESNNRRMIVVMNYRLSAIRWSLMGGWGGGGFGGSFAMTGRILNCLRVHGKRPQGAFLMWNEKLNSESTKLMNSIHYHIVLCVNISPPAPSVCCEGPRKSDRATLMKLCDLWGLYWTCFRNLFTVTDVRKVNSGVIWMTPIFWLIFLSPQNQSQSHRRISML